MDANLLLHDKSLFADDPMFILEPMEGSYKQDYMRLISENSIIKGSSSGEQVWEEMWLDRINENKITYSVLSPETREFMGYCQYKDLTTSKPDIGIEILPQFQRKGLGYAVCNALIRVFFEKTPLPEIYYKVERKNTASIALIKKLGGTQDSVYHTHEQLLSALNALTVEDIAERARNAPALIASLQKYSNELSAQEYPTDILIYRIDRDRIR